MKNNVYAFFSGIFVAVSILISVVIFQDYKENKKIVTELQKKQEEVKLLMPLEEYIKSEQYFCAIKSGEMDIEEYTECKEIGKIKIHQTDNGNYFFGDKE